MKVETAGSEPGVVERGQGPTMSNPRPTGNPEVSEVRGCRTGFPPHTTPTRDDGANLKRDGPSFFAQCWRQLPLLPCLKIHHPLARKNKTPTTPPRCHLFTHHILSLSLSVCLFPIPTPSVKMFMASRIQTRAFSASARNVSLFLVLVLERFFMFFPPPCKRMQADLRCLSPANPLIAFQLIIY